MADIHIDIERMIMHSNYLLEVDNSSASNGLSDMERKQYLDQIKELVQTVQTLLDANIALGNLILYLCQHLEQFTFGW